MPSTASVHCSTPGWAPRARTHGSGRERRVNREGMCNLNDPGAAVAPLAPPSAPPASLQARLAGTLPPTPSRRRSSGTGP
jgi:hypothetical protein